MMRYRYEKKHKMYVQRTLKERKMVKSLAETRTGAGSHEKEEENVVNDSEPSTSSTLGVERRTAISILVKAMAFF